MPAPCGGSSSVGVPPSAGIVYSAPLRTSGRTPNPWFPAWNTMRVPSGDQSGRRCDGATAASVSANRATAVDLAHVEPPLPGQAGNEGQRLAVRGDGGIELESRDRA